MPALCSSRSEGDAMKKWEMIAMLATLWIVGLGALVVWIRVLDKFAEVMK